MESKVREAFVCYRGRAKTAKVSSPNQAAAFVRSIIGGNARECFVAVYLDGRNAPITYSIVSVGTATASLVHPREVFQPAVHVGAVSVIVAHNHPSGEVEPSSEDAEVTTRLRDAGKLLGIGVIDSLIVSDDAYYSFQESGRILGGGAK